MPTVLANAITIADVIRGDVNLDRTVDQRDGVLLSRYIGGWKLDFTDKQKQAANVYGDSKINSKDGVRLSQLLVGYENLADSTETISLMSTSNTKLTVGGTEAIAGDIIYVLVSISDNTGNVLSQWVFLPIALYIIYLQILSVRCCKSSA